MTVKGSEIEYVLIVPKGVSPEQPEKTAEKPGEKPEEKSEQSMALPKGKALKISGAEIETLTLTPKGQKEEKKEKEEEKKMPGQEEQKALTDMQEQFSAMKRERDEIAAKYTSIVNTMKTNEVDQIIALRLARGTIKDDQVVDATDRLGKLPLDVVHTLLSDEKSMKPKEEPVSAGAGSARVKLSDKGKQLTEEQQLRQGLFGHADPLPGGEV